MKPEQLELFPTDEIESVESWFFYRNAKGKLAFRFHRDSMNAFYRYCFLELGHPEKSGVATAKKSTLLSKGYTIVSITSIHELLAIAARGAICKFEPGVQIRRWFDGQQAREIRLGPQGVL